MLVLDEVDADIGVEIGMKALSGRGGSFLIPWGPSKKLGGAVTISGSLAKRLVDERAFGCRPMIVL
jgi:hypothetical protein